MLLYISIALSMKTGVSVDEIPDQVGDDRADVLTGGVPSWPAATGHLYSVLSASAGSAVAAFHERTVTSATVMARTRTKATIYIQ